MVQRRITEDEVVETLLSPDELVAGDGSEMVALRHFAVRQVRVVFEEIDDDTVVVYTVMQVRIRG